METKAICKGIIVRYGTRYKLIVPHMPTYISFDDQLETIDGGLIPIRKLIPFEAEPAESGDPAVAVTTYPVKSDIIKAVKRMVRDESDETTAKEKLERIRNIVEEGIK